LDLELYVGDERGSYDAHDSHDEQQGQQNVPLLMLSTMRTSW
jgi:hypothetical protein